MHLETLSNGGVEEEEEEEGNVKDLHRIQHNDVLCNKVCGAIFWNVQNCIA